jgi:predicted TIM-barrel fold metal-dependent hydrolase
MIIDAHLHLPIVSEERTYEQAKQVLLADLEKNHIDYAILIPDNVLDSPIGDVDTCLKLVEGEPKLFLMGTIDIENQGEAWIRKLETLIIQRKIVGMKIFPGHDPIYPTDPRLFPVYALCQRYDVPMVIHTGCTPGNPDVAKYNDPKHIVQIAQLYPSLKIVIAHYFFPEVEYCYDLTHTYPNIYFDTSGLADQEVIDATGLEKIQGVLVKTLNDGPEKVIFGTDYAMCSHQDHIDLINALPVSTEVRERIFWRNAVEVFHLNMGPDVLALS